MSHGPVECKNSSEKVILKQNQRQESRTLPQYLSNIIDDAEPNEDMRILSSASTLSIVSVGRISHDLVIKYNGRMAYVCVVNDFSA